MNQLILSKPSQVEIDKMLNIIHRLEIKDVEKDFNCPVDNTIYPSYAEIIKKPMDLNTLKRKLEKRIYKRIDNAFRDLRLIWSNCKTFNNESSAIYKSALELEKLSEDLIKKYFKPNKECIVLTNNKDIEMKDIETDKIQNKPKTKNKIISDDDEDENQTDEIGLDKDKESKLALLNNDEKLEFNMLIVKLNRYQLSNLMDEMYKHCQECITITENSNLQIIVDKANKSILNILKLISNNK